MKNYNNDNHGCVPVIFFSYKILYLRNTQDFLYNSVENLIVTEMFIVGRQKRN